MNAWMPAEPPFDPSTFSGVGRMFPLPQVVSFPHVVTPLHVFEPRYRALTAEALDGDGLITMAVLRPGWESDYAGRPPLCQAGCLTKIISHHKDAEGRYNLLLLGLRRVELIEEIEPPESFRRSRIRILPERDSDRSDSELRSRLTSLLLKSVKADAAADELEQALDRDATLGSLTDLAAHSLPLEAELKLALLGEPDPCVRGEMILRGLSGEDGSAAEFPPPFSAN